jgi:flagellar biosynthesis protein FlhF
MRIKKYVAKSMREALLQIKEELGEDAIILKTSKMPKKMFGPEEIEVTAAVDEDSAAPRPPAFQPLNVSALGGGADTALYGRPRPAARAGGIVEPAMPELPEPRGMPELPEPGWIPELPEPKGMPPDVRPYTPPRLSSGQGRDDFGEQGDYRRPAAPAARTAFPSTKRGLDEISEIKADVNELKDLVKTILVNAAPQPAVPPAKNSHGSLPFAQPDHTSVAATGTNIVAGGIAGVSDCGWDAFVKRLTDSEVKPALAKRLVDSVRGGSQITDAELEKRLENALSEQFPVSGPLKLKKGAPLTVAFVGPTGSGKTTTLAKLAAHCCFTKSKKISIITADTYRIAAIEQIRVFADIVNVGLQVIFSPDEIPAAIAACEGSDVVFVDTAGRSQRNREHMEELRLLTDVLRPDETHLVLSATTKDSDLIDMVHNYRNVRVNRLLFTKLDETARLGNIFNVVSELGIPVSYFTVGQSVPDDIELAQAGKFVKKLMEGRAM